MTRQLAAVGMMVLTGCVAPVWSYPMFLPIVMVKGELEHLIACEQSVAAPMVLDRLLLPGHRRVWAPLPARDGARGPTLTGVFQPAPARRIVEQPAA